VKGDVFISRCGLFLAATTTRSPASVALTLTCSFYDNEDVFTRLSMGPGDLSSTSKWFEISRNIIASRKK
jgi:hypothetical protein